MTMYELGTPWALEYIGSGRLTGLVAAEPVMTDTGEVAPGWRYVGYLTEEAFYELAESEQIGYLTR